MTEHEEYLKKELMDAAKNWLAIDGLWFLAIEERYGLETAISCDVKVWKDFSKIEADRIKKRLHLPETGTLDDLEKALHHRLFCYLDEYTIKRPDKNTLEIFMQTCRTQTARTRKNLPLFPCKKIGIVDYETFARQINPAIRTECISCPPDPRPDSYFCGWRFTLLETTIS
ncbi:MAG: hypothetical protein GXY48_02795 [Methanomicrobiales archaeon]|nr:hypothetical protein [Methanomicrobiales archaeon]